MRRCNRRTQLVLLTAGLSLLLLAIYLVGALIPESAYASDYLAAKLPPSWEHPFGTDSLGRDLLMRTLKGLSISMTVGLAASAIAMEGEETINPALSIPALRARAGL